MAIEHNLDTPLARAVRAAGSQSAFGRIIRRSQSYVHGLLRDGKEVTPKEALLADSAGIASKHDLSTEIFPREPAAPASLAVSPDADMAAAR